MRLVLFLQTGFWEMDYAYLKAIEGPIVDGVGLGYPGFFALPGQVRPMCVDVLHVLLGLCTAAGVHLVPVVFPHCQA